MKEKRILSGKKIGFAVTGSYCTFSKALPVMAELSKDNKVFPIFSNNVSITDTRFYKAEDFFRECAEVTANVPITSIVEAEPIGPNRLLDILLIAPCTGNTLAKLAAGITDTPVLVKVMKLHL